MKVLVCGGREYTNAKHVYRVLDETIGITTIISGCAKGADTLALKWAVSRQVDFKGYPARWGKDGLRAGPERNQRMLEDNDVDLVIAFPGGRGTADMLRRARANGIWVRLAKERTED
jgi:hypothetical protein